MKSLFHGLAAIVLLSLGVHPAAAQETLAFSRQVSVVNDAPGSLAFSRQVSVLSDILGSLAASRPVSVVSDVPGSLAASRQVSARLKPYSVDDMATALRIAAGLRQPAPDEAVYLDVVSTPPSAGVVDILDAQWIYYLQSIVGLNPLK